METLALFDLVHAAAVDQWQRLVAQYPDAPYLAAVAAGGVFLLLSGGKPAADHVSFRTPSATRSPEGNGRGTAAGRNGITPSSPAAPSSARAHTRLPIRDAARVIRDARRTAQPVWAAEGIFGTYVLSILSAFAKTGKTYAVLGLLRAMQDGGTFFGLSTTPLRVLYCTEQNAATFGQLLQTFGITGKHVHVLYRADVRGWHWPSLVTELEKQARKRKCRGIVLDTLAAWCPSAEQGAEAAEAALGPLQELTAKGYAVLLVHHDRKTGGAHGLSLRGHGALAAIVDVILSLERGKTDKERILVCAGRYGEARLVAQLDGTQYVVRTTCALPASTMPEPSPESESVSTPLLPPGQQAILTALDTLPRLPNAPGVPFMVLRRALDVPLASLHRRLAALERAGLIAATEQRRVRYWHRTQPAG